MQIWSPWRTSLAQGTSSCHLHHQTPSKPIKPSQTVFKSNQTNLNLSQTCQTCETLPKLIKVDPNISNPIQTKPNLYILIKTCSNIIQVNQNWSMSYVLYFGNIWLSSHYFATSLVDRWRWFILIFFQRGWSVSKVDCSTRKTVLGSGAQVDQPPLLTHQTCRTYPPGKCTGG